MFHFSEVDVTFPSQQTYWPRFISIRCIGIEPYLFTKDYHASFNRQNFQLRIVVFAVHKLDRVFQIGTHDHEKGKL